MTFSIPSALTALCRFLELLLDAVALPRRTEALVRTLTLDDLHDLVADSDEPLPYHEAAVQALVWELKYRKNPRAAALAGAALTERLMAVAAEELGTPLLLPIPMHPTRRTERGYNQTELLCEAALRYLFDDAKEKEPRRGLSSATARELRDFSAEKSRTPEGLLFTQPLEYAPGVLVRTHATPPQQGLPRYERLRNIKNAMQADTARVRGRACVVVDDVTTTGATFEEAKRALASAGARAVHCIALARS